MKKLLILFLLLPIFGTSQELYLGGIWRDADNQIVNNDNKATVGDTITLNYILAAQTSGIKYLTFDGQWNNDHLTAVPDSFTFDLSAMNDPNLIAERYVYENKVWDQDTPSDCNDLQNERDAWLDGKPYSDNQMFSIERIAIQAAGGDIASLDLQVVAKQKFVVKEPAVTAAGEYSLTIATAEYADGVSLNGVVPTQCTYPVAAKLPVDYQIVLDFVLPSTIDPTEMTAMIIEGASSFEEVSMTSTMTEVSLDSDSKVTLMGIELDLPYRANLNPIGATYIDDVITVTDAYRAFKGLNDVGINGNESIFDDWERFIADVNLDNKFNSQDVYLLLSKVIGSPAEESCIPYVLNGDANYGCFGSVKYENYAQFIVMDPDTEQDDRIVFTTQEAETLTIKNQQMAFWHHGDIDFSHSTPPIGSANTTGKSFNLSNKVVSSANINVDSKIEGDKVIVDLNLTTSGLAGIQSKIDFDTSVLQLEEIRYDTGNTVTNFNKVVGGKVVFGSLSLEGDKIETGTAYQLVFTMKQNVTNTTGLFYFYNTDAVRQSGEKLNLNIQ